MSQGRLAYVCLARLPGRAAYFLWHSDPDAPEPDGVLLDADGGVPAFADPGAARRYAAGRGLAVAPDAPHVYDLARVAAWCDAPAEVTTDCEALLDAWNLFTDLGPAPAGVTSLFGRAERAADAVYDKLFFGCNTPAVTPPGAAYTPAWDPAELDALSAVLRRGLGEFADRLRGDAV